MTGTERVMTMIDRLIYGNQGFFSPSSHTRTYLDKLMPRCHSIGYGIIDAKENIRSSFGYYSMTS
jgi:hypothetical protein